MKGFSLAEILITLGIIGIIAAITITSIYENIQKKQTVSKLQKAIAEINQAYKLSTNEMGEPTSDEAFSMGAKEYFNKYWAPYIKVSTYCTPTEKCGYKTGTFKYKNGQVAYTILIGDSIGDIATAFLTADGIYYAIRTGTGSDHGLVKTEIIIVDINGAKQPNIVGKDVFILSRVIDDSKGSIILPNCYNNSNTSIDINCKTYGHCCAEKIKRAGWKIDSTYPW